MVENTSANASWEANFLASKLKRECVPIIESPKFASLICICSSNRVWVRIVTSYKVGRIQEFEDDKPLRIVRLYHTDSADCPGCRLPDYCTARCTLPDCLGTSDPPSLWVACSQAPLDRGNKM